MKLDTGKLLVNSAYWLGLPLLITLIGYMPGDLVTHSSLLLLYLFAVLFTSLRSDLASVLACAATGFLLFNFFHTQPRYSLQMHVAEEVTAALVFITFAVLSGGIAGKLSRQLQLLKEQKVFFRTQVEFFRQVQDTSDSAGITALLNRLFGDLFDPSLHFSLRSEADGNERLYWDSNGNEPLSPDHEAMLLSLREQVQNLLQRMETARALKAAERESDEEKLRSALLSSVSHDLKTPLVTMLGAATSLRDLRQDLSSEDAAELLDSIISESQRLESYIQNLLDMTRLGHGKLSLTRDWVSIEEIYHVVARRISRLVEQPVMALRMNGDIPSLHVHAALIEQGLFNVIENALKAAGKDAELLVEVSQTEGCVELRVCDQGPGLPRAQWQAVFDPFYSFSLGDCYEKGTGLGLSICRSIFRVHGGEACIVEAPAGFNHCVLLSLPLSQNNQMKEGEEHD